MEENETSIIIGFMYGPSSPFMCVLREPKDTVARTETKDQLLLVPFVQLFSPGLSSYFALVGV